MPSSIICSLKNWKPLNLLQQWYRPQLTFLTLLLWPLSCLFGMMICLRRFLYRKGLKKSYRFPVPVMVVGNITVGGTGKTPFVIALVQLLLSHGYKPGIVSRGVGGRKHKIPRWVQPEDDAREVGDEAMLLAKRTACPVVVCVDRVKAVQALLNASDCTIVISDDGLQHYALQRDMEIIIVDQTRQWGNGLLLPAGPLREPLSRLSEADIVVDHGEKGTMQLKGDRLVLLKDERVQQPLKTWAHQSVHAVAGIGHPDRFFSQLTHHLLKVIPHAFPDHYRFEKKDIDFTDDFPVIMTEKDAVKCKHFADDRHWFLPVDAIIAASLEEKLLSAMHSWRKSPYDTI